MSDFRSETEAQEPGEQGRIRKTAKGVEAAALFLREIGLLVQGPDLIELLLLARYPIRGKIDSFFFCLPRLEK